MESWWSPTRTTWPGTGLLAITPPLLTRASFAGWPQCTLAPTRFVLCSHCSICEKKCKVQTKILKRDKTYKINQKDSYLQMAQWIFFYCAELNYQMFSLLTTCCDAFSLTRRCPTQTDASATTKTSANTTTSSTEPTGTPYKEVS